MRNDAGSPLGRTAKANGNAVRTASLATYEYEPYGGAYYNSGLALNVGFTGHQWDPNMGLYYAPFRWYNPDAARWPTRDPLGYKGGLNLYGYVGGNPIRFLDWLGLTPLTPEEGDTVGICVSSWLNVKRRKGAGASSNREDGVDCSGLVWCVFKDTDWPYPYTPTSSWPPDGFVEVSEPQNGDVMVGPGHGGIYKDGKVIHSSTNAGKVVTAEIKDVFKNGHKYWRRDKPDQSETSCSSK